MTPLLNFSANHCGRDFVVGDIHGCYSAFRAALDHVKFHHASDRIFSVGDLVDRGPQSYDTLQLLRQPWFFSCKGNHEQMLLDHLRAPHENKPHDSAWLLNVFSNFTDRQRFSGVWIPILERLPYVMKVGTGLGAFYVVHAEILEERATVTQSMIDGWQFQDPIKAKRRALWGRSLLKAYEQGRPVRRAHDPTLPLIFCGHSITPQPLRLARQVYLDGGAYVAYDYEARANMEPDFQPRLRLFEVKKNICWSVNGQSGDVEALDIERPSTL